MLFGLPARLFRTWHRRVAYVASIPLLMTISTGVAHRVLKSAGATKDSSAVLAAMMPLHEGRYLPAVPASWAPVLYTTILCALCTVLAISGGQLVRPPWALMQPKAFADAVLRNRPKSARSWHQKLASAAVFCIAFQAWTGFAYRFARNALDMAKPDVQWLLALHGGNWMPLLLNEPFGAGDYGLALVFRTIFVLFSGGLCGSLAVSGGVMSVASIKRWVLGAGAGAGSVRAKADSGPDAAGTATVVVDE